MKNRIEVTPAHTAGLPCDHEMELAELLGEVQQLRARVDAWGALAGFLNVEPLPVRRRRARVGRPALRVIDGGAR